MKKVFYLCQTLHIFLLNILLYQVSLTNIRDSYILKNNQAIEEVLHLATTNSIGKYVGINKHLNLVLQVYFRDLKFANKSKHEFRL